jgi:hypothetical protein
MHETHLLLLLTLALRERSSLSAHKQTVGDGAEGQTSWKVFPTLGLSRREAWMRMMARCPPTVPWSVAQLQLLPEEFPALGKYQHHLFEFTITNYLSPKIPPRFTCTKQRILDQRCIEYQGEMGKLI